MKKVLILGSTGSIGINALDVIKKFPLEFKIAGLTTNKNIDLLQKQINEFKPEIVAVKDKSKALDLNHAIKNKCNVLAGDEGILNISRTVDYDILISAMVGFAGFNPTIEGIKRGKRIALANKETLVAAGELVINLCKEHNADLIPIDSEHSAIFQCMNGEDKREVEKIILTASGGPFLNHDMESLKNVTVTEALRHPTWDMGDKITIDSATMMNKGLEVIEAHWLFNLPKEKIKVIVHPQSIIHSMVEFIDGSIKAQLSTPDMRLPIQYALTYPYRLESEFVKTHLAKLHKLTFFEPDLNKFECLKLAYEVLEIGGAAPCILNAANETAVDKFLKNKIKFLEIPTAIKKALNYFQTSSTIGLETIFECDRQTRAYINEIYN
ncbi:MAG: 1-deoxy-D-xylulose-5-phosphate reductoisomerase [Ignavibacteria bacterium RBG_13_36_8]|nr:MAG: 1-deoxy-D-xylulose-5-phosphate reductoisomerase [Ignavibacteria bacterium RBG_13_36_8]